jgi:diguanylate cyclase (GGDEF)-like protein
MTGSERSVDEGARLEALRRLGLLDTPAEESYDRIVRIAARVLDVPIALVTLVDADRQWFKARIGLDVAETSRDIAFCAHVVAQDSDEVLIVNDASTDRRFSDNPLVLGDPGIRFYAGQPLHAPGGEIVGTLCVIDRQPRQLSGSDLLVLADLAGLVEELMARESMTEVVTALDTAERALRASEALHSTTLAALTQGVIVARPNGEVILMNGAAQRILGYDAASLAAVWRSGNWQTYDGDGGVIAPADHPLVQAWSNGRPIEGTVFGWQHADGHRVLLSLSASRVEGLAEAQIVITFVDVSERHRLTQLFAHQAVHDPLTGLLNRRSIDDTLGPALGRARALGRRLAVCYLDLDDFKSINDTLGHGAGDEVLVAAADRLRGGVRAGDTVARLGGDEFLAVFDPIGGEAEAEALAARLIKALCVPYPSLANCGLQSPCASAGVAMSLVADDAESLLMRADGALRVAKRAGKAQVAIA